MFARAWNAIQDRRGVTALEYAVIAGVMIIVTASAAYTQLGPAVAAQFGSVNSALVAMR